MTFTKFTCRRILRPFRRCKQTGKKGTRQTSTKPSQLHVTKVWKVESAAVSECKLRNCGYGSKCNTVDCRDGEWRLKRINIYYRGIIERSGTQIHGRFG